MSEHLIRTASTYVKDVTPMCPCGTKATTLLEMHAVDYCTPWDQTVASFRCSRCLERDILKVQNLATTGKEWCSSCGMSITSMSDLIVRICPL